MEGRQAAIIARILHDDTETARAMLDGSAITQPWEHQVSSCLAAMCAAPETIDELLSAVVEQFHAHQPVPGYAVYRARWGLTAANIGLPGYQVAIGFSDGPDAQAFAKRVIDRLKMQWRVETIPSDKGALPLKSCGASQA